MNTAELLDLLPSAGDYGQVVVMPGRGLWCLHHRPSGGWHRVKVGRGDQRRYFLGREAYWLRRLGDQLPLPRCRGLHQRGDRTLLITDFLPGDTLSQHIRAHEGHSPDTTQLLAQLVDMLLASHRAGVVHGDIKPGNLLYDGRQLHLLDWACAAATDTPIADLPYRAFSPSYSLPSRQQGLGRIEPLQDWYACLVIMRLLQGGGLARPDWQARQPATDAFAAGLARCGLPESQRLPLENAMRSIDSLGSRQDYSTAVPALTR